MLDGARHDATTFTLLALEALLVEQDPTRATAVAEAGARAKQRQPPALNLVSVSDSDGVCPLAGASAASLLFFK
jgi:hypothetical protein